MGYFVVFQVIFQVWHIEISSNFNSHILVLLSVKFADKIPSYFFVFDVIS